MESPGFRDKGRDAFLDRTAFLVDFLGSRMPINNVSYHHAFHAFLRHFWMMGLLKKDHHRLYISLPPIMVKQEFRPLRILLMAEILHQFIGS